MRTIIVLLSLLGYVFSYSICEYFFSQNIEMWYTLKYTTFSTIIALLVLSNKVEDDTLLDCRKTNFLLNIYLGVIASDIIDRCFFTTDLTSIDWIMLALNISINIVMEFKLKIANLINLYFGNDSST